MNDDLFGPPLVKTPGPVVCYDAMIDTEFLSPAIDGALVSIGVVLFDLETETVGSSFAKRIHIATSLRDGGTVNAGTLMWWMRQSDDVRNQVWTGGTDIRAVLRDLGIWLGLQCGRRESGTPNVRPWGNSAKTDLGIVESAFERAHTPLPWHWSNERDFRTVRKLNPQVEYNPEEKGEGAHDPLVDCRFQIEHLFKIKRYRRGGLT